MPINSDDLGDLKKTNAMFLQQIKTLNNKLDKVISIAIKLPDAKFLDQIQKRQRTLFISAKRC